MENINFKTDGELYDKFRLVCTMNKIKFQDKLTELIKKYVSENENLLSNPEIQEKMGQGLPDFFAEPRKWHRYIYESDTTRFNEITNRIHLLRFLLHDYVIQKGYKLDDVVETTKLKNALHLLEVFRKSEDGKHLSKNHGDLILHIQKEDPVLRNS